MVRLAAPADPRGATLETSVQYVRGVGPKRAEQLAAHGIVTVGDLLEYAPFRYEDRTRFRPLSSVRDGEWILTRGTVASVGEFHGRGRSLSIFEMLVTDGSGALTLKFFNQPYLRSVYRERQELVIYGQARRDPFLRRGLSLINPECEILDADESGGSVHSGRVVPVYRKLGDLRTRRLRQIMHGALERLAPGAEDPLPAGLLRRLHLQPRKTALARIHFPELRESTAEGRDREMAQLNLGLSAAHKRMIFEELFLTQVGIALAREKRARLRKERTLQTGDRAREAIKKVLPFHPTAAQKRVLREIVDDMRSSHPMSRLLQGDVGSGKTIVAAQAAIVAVENGLQVAVMAPTEILAEQHYFYFRRLLDPLGYGIDLLKGGLRTKQRREAIERIRSAETSVVVGTHALIQQGVEFSRLGLAIIDEQHRFGVVQRNLLREKGDMPDVLVMTATPIPRSLALTLYGDLDVSVIDELPPGRKPVETRWYAEKDRAKAYDEMRRTISAGGQVYVVYPLVEESEKSDLRAATEMAAHLEKELFPEVRVGLLHGKMKSSQKESVMAALVSGEIRILVATTVIEVGVDVQNATLMVIEHAERFGLAQLHQLRGRVGRGKGASMCLLIGSPGNSLEARRRLEIMCETSDGFRIAEVDLELRGPGEIIGTRQSGIPAFRFANVVRDRKALETARDEATRLLTGARSGDLESRGALLGIQQRLQQRFGLTLAG